MALLIVAHESLFHPANFVVGGNQRLELKHVLKFVLLDRKVPAAAAALTPSIR